MKILKELMLIAILFIAMLGVIYWLLLDPRIPLFVQFGGLAVLLAWMLREAKRCL